MRHESAGCFISGAIPGKLMLLDNGMLWRTHSPSWLNTNSTLPSLLTWSYAVISDNLKLILGLLCCPDDAGSLGLLGAHLGCERCGRDFPLYGEDFAELLPRAPVQLPGSINEDYRNAYLSLFEQQFKADGTGLAWGAEESTTDSWMRKRRRQVRTIGPLVTEGIDSDLAVLCDIAAGAGHYTFAYKDHFRLVLHCDLSIENLNYCRRKAKEQQVQNIFFLRIDYFQPPFRHSLDRILCLDTLIRGEEHDSMLLKSISRCLKPDGTAVVDFHNWWHNPLRRLGILPENFRSNRSYAQAETMKLLRNADFREATLFPFVQEFEPGSKLEKISSTVLPPTRLVYRIRSKPVTPRQRPSSEPIIEETSRVAGL
jgi:ubiquinone/menaquinone biosynthesis C-methylase UbiE